MHILLNLLKPEAILMLFVALTCLLGYAYPGWTAKTNLAWLIWTALGFLALVAWIILIIA